MPNPFSIPSPPADWASFQIGIFTIRSYALCILVGIVLAILITSRRLTKRGAEPGVVLDIAIWAVPLGLVGARLFHVFTHPSDYFASGDSLWKVFAIWEGGNAIFGALIGGAIGVWIACRITGLRFFSFADALAPGLLVAQAVGRIGNWFNVELYGQPTSLPWGLVVPSTNAAYPAGLPKGTLFAPTFLYELIWDLLGALVIVLIERRASLRWGRAIGLYFVWYGIGRSYLESIRIDPTEVLFGLRVNVWAAFVAILLGLVLIRLASRHPGEEPSVYRPGREWAGPSGVGSRYTAADFDESAAPDRVPVTSGSSDSR